MGQEFSSDIKLHSKDFITIDTLMGDFIDSMSETKYRICSGDTIAKEHIIATYRYNLSEDRQAFITVYFNSNYHYKEIDVTTSAILNEGKLTYDKSKFQTKPIKTYAIDPETLEENEIVIYDTIYSLLPVETWKYKIKEKQYWVGNYDLGNKSAKWLRINEEIGLDFIYEERIYNNNQLIGSTLFDLSDSIESIKAALNGLWYLLNSKIGIENVNIAVSDRASMRKYPNWKFYSTLEFLDNGTVTRRNIAAHSGKIVQLGKWQLTDDKELVFEKAKLKIVFYTKDLIVFKVLE